MNSPVTVRDFMSRENSIQKIFKNSFIKVFAYPQNDVRTVAKIMSDVKAERLPVLFSPWNRKLVGYIELDKISAFLKD